MQKFTICSWSLLSQWSAFSSNEEHALTGCWSMMVEKTF